jgi:uncharacterized membrane protein
VTGAITPWLHILGVAMWVGPQFFLFIAAVPAVRTIDDTAARARVMRKISTRFGWMAWAALLLIVLTGISNLFQLGADTAIDLGSPDYRWYHVFTFKMVLMGAMVILTAVHTFVIGPRQLALMESGESGGEAVRMRRVSIALSSVALLLSIVVVFLGALLNDHEWSFQEV